MPSGRNRFCLSGGRIAVLLGLGLAFGDISAPAAEPVPVAVVFPKPAESAPPLRLTGTVTAERQAALSPRTSGLVVAVHVDAGDEVRWGDVLLELDPALAELDLRRTGATVAEARARLADARRILEEGHALGRNLPQSQLRAREAEVEIAASVVARLEAELGRQAELVARHSVIAPFDGVISRKLAESGEWVETGTAVLELVATDRLRLDVQVPQEHIAAIVLDAPVAVGLDPLPGRRFEGRVAAKVPVSDPASRSFLVRVLIEDPSGAAAAGMSAEVAFELPRDRESLSLPRDAVFRYPDGTTSVWIVADDDGVPRAAERQVRLGRTLAETVEVIEGLEPGLPVVVRGNEGLVEGEAVRILDGGRGFEPGPDTG